MHTQNESCSQNNDLFESNYYKLTTCIQHCYSDVRAPYNDTLVHIDNTSIFQEAYIVQLGQFLVTIQEGKRADDV